MLVIVFVIGFCAGLRSLTPPAVLAWAVYLGWLKLDLPFVYIGSLAAVVVFSALAAMELIADKLPQIPDRTSAPGLAARIVAGGFSGMCIAAAGMQGVFAGAALGAAGGIAGCFSGHRVRREFTKRFGMSDLYIALLEDSVALAGSMGAVALARLAGSGPGVG